ncbi:bifunctional diaminohydroxyphosphoribosylaminopyrimidine deaminase/5-amino-6-(5-phosphoribosylamino)uracil reductase RibD [Marinicella sp. S1101]|uniref:bifunctional diaminohydroxyphosphoribosylaminopyrimidine deaminase/5-amino-6-(5-phosphoribosylamino)uracil reductase RibD n=1 Tax=Marinicella marina TaxID=2996016 RepID=UPI002260EA1F|nr:bifunctional diaminohydroxyphosphoribosylaminopyrimidine deaminase/5-amino-6-(5-phosphoribosylamino)uracil reductase RibD [Marinicella marina]MCX7554899.1 bifunctional diaminohydroxyphosphoribosylaminopyrimidine deaminase/5-amino-6-(5-phosphoribosylamino)uracil reductase RibD [Marinicella marina]MDJ1141277.1 bifunctional diaminohydroxyphosphoribosylaminopyrimidine deaminase/5-amino-6-(5-phosphoribosylamino)uracil reductase RibD [Marinicella marina]
MKKALAQAKHGLFSTGANPRVGCVLVKDGQVIAQAYHQQVGGPHAEALALKQAGDQAKGCTAYVTLEPCSHVGKNPPCADALIAAGVSEVVVCNDDPNPLVAGAGYRKLMAAGIAVTRDVLIDEGTALNQGFLHRMHTGLPWVRTKSAQSIDGRTAMASGESVWITGPQARADVQYWRGRSGAIITGIETVLNDDCRLNFRADDLPKKQQKYAHKSSIKQPVRVVVDSQLRTPFDAKILTDTQSVLIVTANTDKDQHKPFTDRGIDVQSMPGIDGRVDLKALVSYLGRQQINEVLVESGAQLSGAFVAAGLVNELIIYTAPVLMGSTGRPLFELNIEEMNNRHHIKVTSIKAVGNDWRIRGLINQ